MSTLPHALEKRIADVLLRVERLEKAQDGERHLNQWRYLVERPHSWRRQLCIKGRNMTAAQLVNSMHANHLTAEEAAADFGLPLEAMHEAVRYCRENSDLLALEASEERRRLIEKGYCGVR